MPVRDAALTDWHDAIALLALVVRTHKVNRLEQNPLSIQAQHHAVVGKVAHLVTQARERALVPAAEAASGVRLRLEVLVESLELVVKEVALVIQAQDKRLRHLEMGERVRLDVLSFHHHEVELVGVVVHGHRHVDSDAFRLDIVLRALLKWLLILLFFEDQYFFDRNSCFHYRKLWDGFIC